MSMAASRSIRRMRPADAEAVAGLLSASWKRTYEHLMGLEKVEAANARLHAPEALAAEAGDNSVIAFVAEAADGAIVGHAMAKMDASRKVWLERLHVAPRQFGSGLAADLLRAILAAHAGLASVSLEVIDGNDRAIAFYRKHGFVVTARKSACGSVEGVPTLVMTRILPRA
jgi:ribosomal protein S18 acetylase RimI-like enzyme